MRQGELGLRLRDRAICPMISDDSLLLRSAVALAKANSAGTLLQDKAGEI